MNYVYETLIFLFLTFIVFVIIKKNNIGKENEKILSDIENKTKKKIVNTVKKVAGNNLSMGDVKNSGGIISKKIILPGHSKEKIARWVDTKSYEDDINQNIIHEQLIEQNEEEMKKITIRPLILLVDDSLVVRKYVGDLLKKHNYDLVFKTDGWEAITYLNGNYQKPDLIITDIQMPNMDGFQLIEAIRKEKKFNNLPIIVISAHVGAHDHLILMEEENIQGFVRKPFEDTDLTLQVKYLINNY